MWSATERSSKSKPVTSCIDLVNAPEVLLIWRSNYSVHFVIQYEKNTP